MNTKPVKIAPQIMDLPDVSPELESEQSAISKEIFTDSLTTDISMGHSPHVANAIKQSLVSKPLYRESDRFAQKLRSKLAFYTGLDAKHIRCFAGHAAALHSIFQTYLGRDREVLMVTSADEKAHRAAIATGANLRNVIHENMFMPRVDEVVAHISPKTRLIYISNPGWPTGVLWNSSELVFLLSYAQDSMFVVDESFFEFTNETAVPLIDNFINLVVVRSLSNAFGIAGADISYALSDCLNWRYIDRIGIDFAPNSLAQTAAEAALDDLGFARKLVESIKFTKELIYNKLSEAGYSVIQTPGNFILVGSGHPSKIQNTLEGFNISLKGLEHIEGFEDYTLVSIDPFVDTTISAEILRQNNQVNPASNRLSSPVIISHSGPK